MAPPSLARAKAGEAVPRRRRQGKQVRQLLRTLVGILPLVLLPALPWPGAVSAAPVGGVGVSLRGDFDRVVRSDLTAVPATATATASWTGTTWAAARRAGPSPTAYCAWAPIS
jgi:hypothetical protein